MSSFVLDASAVIAVLNQEPGADRVEQVLASAVISSVNLAEILAKSVEAGLTIDIAREAFNLLGIPVIEFTYEQAYASAKLRPATRSLGLSLGDRSCLALAISRGATAMTADRNWQMQNACPVELIR